MDPLNIALQILSLIQFLWKPISKLKHRLQTHRPPHSIRTTGQPAEYTGTYLSSDDPDNPETFSKGQTLPTYQGLYNEKRTTWTLVAASTHEEPDPLQTNPPTNQLILTSFFIGAALGAAITAMIFAVLS